MYQFSGGLRPICFHRWNFWRIIYVQNKVLVEPESELKVSVVLLRMVKECRFIHLYWSCCDYHRKFTSIENTRISRTTTLIKHNNLISCRHNPHFLNMLHPNSFRLYATENNNFSS